MKYILLLVVAFFGIELYAQNCKCLSQQFEEIEQEPIKIFNFENGQQFKLCLIATYNFRHDTTTYYKDFIILNCVSKKAINSPEKTEYYSIYFNRDTLSIEGVIELPVAKNRQFIMTAISVTKYYFKDNTLIIMTQNTTLPRYNTREIQSTLNEYKKANKNTDFKQLYSRLLIAGFSDNSEAMNYFTNFEKTFGNLMTIDEINDYKFLQSLF